MTILQQAITILLCALGTLLTRFLPFLVFNPKKPTPQYIQYLGAALPGAIFAMLVVYCLRNVNVLQFSYGLPELIAIAVTVALHLEAADAPFHRTRHDMLYAAGAVCVLNPSKPYLKGRSFHARH